MSRFDLLHDPSALAAQLEGRRLISAEFMYKPRPSEPRARQVFDFALESRLTELSGYDNSAVVLICNGEATAESLSHLPGEYPNLRFVAALVNPEPILKRPADPYADTPLRSEWHDPCRWRRYSLTDRWSRITLALDTSRQFVTPGYLIMPAHDTVWGRGLLEMLTRLSVQDVKRGVPAAVSVYTPYQHSAVPGVDISPEIIDALNAAFGRDSLLRWRLRFGRYQTFWGKMGMLPFAMCGDILERAQTMVWEDDLEIDRVLREAGYGVRCRWISQPSLYRHALPVFDRAGLRAVIERTLHYSLDIPGDTSLLTRPLDRFARLRRTLSPRFARALALSEAITKECRAEIAQRLQEYGMSWVNWGAYRYVVRVGDPQVQVWKYDPNML